MLRQQKMKKKFNLYQMPPNFKACQVHHNAALLYDFRGEYIEQCQCCNRKIGTATVSICTRTASLLRINQQIPLYFSYIKGIVFMLLIFMVCVGTQRMFSTMSPVQFSFIPPGFDLITSQIGFIQQRQEVRFVFFIIFTILILIVRGFLKKNKYEGEIVLNKISDRSVMLTNVNRRVQVQDIYKKFRKYQIENVVFTFRVTQYKNSLQRIYKLKKQYFLAKEKRLGELKIIELREEIQKQSTNAEKYKQMMRSPEKRLDFAFITFKNNAQKEKFMEKHKSTIFKRLLYKFCTCCSSTAIKSQHINVFEGPDPEDIDWFNLEVSYWTKKIYRITCYYMSFSILIFGILFQYEISIYPLDDFSITIIKNLIVFVGNYLIINLLEFTTYQIERHQINSNKILSLVRKLTFFVFLNLSMSPLSIYVYNQFISTGPFDPIITPFDQLCLSVVIICVGNIFKPLAQYLNVERILRVINFYRQRSKQIQSQMTQQQANHAFEPIEFPIASFYSVLISSLFLTSFFLSCFQILVVVEIISCLVLFVVSKYMLLKVCKEPIGLNYKIGTLCQRLLTLCVPIYWIGQKFMYFILVEQYNRSFTNYILDFNVFYIIQLAIIFVLLFFSPKILSIISRKITQDGDVSDSLIEKANANVNRMTYEELNSIKKLQAQYQKFFDAMN